MKLNDIKAGDTIIADDGFTCMPAGRHIVEQEASSHLFVKCDAGRHYLFTQLDENDDIVGFSKSET